MILVEVKVERLNSVETRHQVVMTNEKVQLIKDELQKTKERLYADGGFVGYYSYSVEELDIDSVLVSDLKLTLKELDRLLTWVRLEEEKKRLLR